MIVAHALEKRFGRRSVLAGLDLEVPPGRVTLLVGANGAGKTTLLRVLAGLTTADRGHAWISGYDVRKERMKALEGLSFLPQAPRFHPRLTTDQVARYYGQVRGIPWAEVRRSLLRWGLADHLAVPTGQLSGGLRQRLAIAIFDLAQASVLLLDEPGLSLDPDWRTRLQVYLTEQSTRGATVLVATHLLGEWEGRVDACLVLENGRVSGELPPDRIRASFAELPNR